MIRVSVRFLAFGLGIAAVSAAGSANAQLIAGPGAGMNAARSSAGQESAPRRPPPPALPGARVDKEMVAPAERPPSEMQPNEALFNSINRGDIAAARDAISRGAELDAKNVLGMTPLELSVDLGRSDISFLLLSMRGSGESAQPPAKAAAATEQKGNPEPKGKPVKQARAGRKAAEPAVRTAADPEPAAPRTPRLFAGDGGAPVPNAGFLGFGGR